MWWVSSLLFFPLFLKIKSIPGGGRAAGDGETTDDQLFFFNSTSISTGRIGFPLVRDAVNEGVGAGNKCLALNPDGFMDSAPCAPPDFTPEQTWIIVG